jgi:prepilin-type N-terminal cleavage/methylation domain-containing protein
MKKCTYIHKAQIGFTLIEMAMVLMIVALLLGGLLPTLSSQVEQRHVNDTRKQLDEIQQALIGYTITNGHLPCPAKSFSDGTENRNATGVCNKRVGLLPWVELGVSKTDSWGRIFLYSATPAFTNAAPATLFNLTTNRDITIQTRDSTGTPINLSKSTDIPAVVLSTGPNGIFGTTDSGLVISSPYASSVTNNITDQKANASVTGTGVLFVSRDPAAPANSTDEAFDDIVIWISPNILLNRMVAAGKLP